MDLFGTAGIRGDVRERLTPELALAVGRAIGADMQAERADASGRRATGNGSAAGTASTGAAPTVVVGRDGRTTGPALASALEAGFESAGVGVARAGRLPTPALAFASRERRGVMVTASHNPPTDNGLKCFIDGQEIDRAVEKRIEKRVETGVDPATWNRWERAETVDPLSAYREAVVEYVRGYGAPLDGLRVAIDCANGVAGLATPQVLRALGAEVLALHANVDGHFPGRESKPTAESLTDLAAFVADRSDPTENTGERTANADRPIDLAIAHDGDGDRIVVLDGEGGIVHEDTIVAILAERYLIESDAADPVVVTTPNASSRIDERVEAAGGRVERVRLGALHEGIANARTGGETGTRVVFAAEPWKHVHPGFGPWIDGVVSAALVSRFVASADLDALRRPVTERPYRKTELECPDGNKESAMERLRATLPEAFPEATVTTQHGVRLDLLAESATGSDRNERNEGGWVLVRPSGTEPYLRIYVESDAIEAIQETTVAVVERAIEATRAA